LDGIATIGASHRPLRDKVVDELRRRIIDGAYQAGDRLTEERLADDFGVSRNPVREAIRVLEGEGFLTAHPRRGAVVASISAKDVEDLFDVRLSLEVLAARLAAERAGSAGAARLDELLAEARGAASVRNLATLNTSFHAAICALSGNALLAGIMESLHGRLQRVYRQSAAERAPHSLAEHERLAAAIRAGDGDAAAEAARVHVLAARRTALAIAAASARPGPDGKRSARAGSSGGGTHGEARPAARPAEDTRQGHDGGQRPTA
jgi:DNA-binding GntR family transcriptional regulator